MRRIACTRNPTFRSDDNEAYSSADENDFLGQARLLEPKPKLEVRPDDLDVPIPKEEPEKETKSSVHVSLYEDILNKIAQEAISKGEKGPANTELGGKERVPAEGSLRHWNLQRVRDEMQETIDGLPKSEKPTVLFVIGHSASGKSSFIDQIYIPEQKQGAFFYINPDELGPFFCGSQETFVAMKRVDLMRGGKKADLAHTDLNDVRFNFIPNEVMKQKKNAVLDSNSVPPVAVEKWRAAGYEVRVVFVEASYQSALQENLDDGDRELAKIESKVKHGLANDEKRAEKGLHSNRALITVPTLFEIRKLARDVTDIAPVEVWISSGDKNKGDNGFTYLGELGDENTLPYYELPEEILEKAGIDRANTDVFRTITETQDTITETQDKRSMWPKARDVLDAVGLMPAKTATPIEVKLDIPVTLDCPQIVTEEDVAEINKKHDQLKIAKQYEIDYAFSDHNHEYPVILGFQEGKMTMHHKNDPTRHEVKGIDLASLRKAVFSIFRMEPKA